MGSRLPTAKAAAGLPIMVPSVEMIASPLVICGKAEYSLAHGDVVTVTRLDRLARSTRDLFNTLAAITAKEAGFRSLADARADTTTAHGRLMLTVLGGLAEFERDLIRARTGEGRARQGERAKPRPKAQTHSAPTARGDQEPRHGRGTPCRDRAQLQR